MMHDGWTSLSKREEWQLLTIDGHWASKRRRKLIEPRLQLYRDAEKILIDEAAWIPLYFPLSHFVVDPTVEGWFNPPLVMPRLRFISVQD